MSKIVLIEDDLTLRENTLQFFLEEGFDAYAAPDGLAGLAISKEIIPDLVLCDVGLPNMNGYEICIALKKEEKLKDIPVIFLTAYSDKEHILKGFEAGGQDYIVKPFNFDELLVRVKAQLELKYKKDVINELNELLKESNTKLNLAYDSIQNSINYAKIIQEGMLPDLNVLQPNGIQYMLIYKPKDIVSGDFYWTEIVNDKIFIAVADCTGHGVPGALLSMSGHNLLNEIINVEKIYNPIEILNKLNSKIRGIFKHELSVIHEGMDIAICVFDIKRKILEYAGANIPVWYFSNNILKKILPDKLSIGENDLENEKLFFTKKNIEFNIGDKFFMFTDGITDQFDKAGKNKLTKNLFEKQLALLSNQTLTSLKNNLLEFLNEWQGDSPQTDDILVFGIEIRIEYELKSQN